MRSAADVRQAGRRRQGRRSSKAQRLAIAGCYTTATRWLRREDESGGSTVDDPLSGKQRIELVLTLLVGLDGRVIHGQIFDPGGRQPLAFADLAVLGSVIQQWLDRYVVAHDERDAPARVGTRSCTTSERWHGEEPGMGHDPGSERSD